MRGRPGLPASKQLPNRIRALRNAKRWTVRQLAEKVGLHERDVGRHELGHRQLKQAQLVLYARALDVDIAELVPSTSPVTEELRELMRIARDLPATTQRKLVKIAQTLIDGDDPPPIERAA